MVGAEGSMDQLAGEMTSFGWHSTLKTIRGKSELFFDPELVLGFQVTASVQISFDQLVLICQLSSL